MTKEKQESFTEIIKRVMSQPIDKHIDCYMHAGEWYWPDGTKLTKEELEECS